ncbi:hypothetical protein [Rhizobium halophytocola]|uniref:Antifreeze protein n=1 Tax=Rhizobium halophytocola TaxID=735519 RepID=A0ABS4E3Z8_9HYPH|nr:hypothetical protein [Rhizobium halophytocola]MBP1852671.1 hypothetical protein [Rhizobium halophytocola]
MFAKLAKTIAIAAAIVATLGAAAPSAYAADGHHRHRGHGGHQAQGGHGHRPGWAPMRMGCAPFRAVEKARWSGMRHARLEHVSPRRVVVSGYRHHRGYDRMTFANRRGCPVVHY